MAKVLCALCKFEVNRKCIKKKNATVNITKRRHCDMYEEDENKLHEMEKRRTAIPSHMRPNWFWNRKEFLKAKKRELEKNVNKEDLVKVQDSKHPLTGDLSRFVQSTVNDGNKDG
jgi:hypothetical protein